MDDLFDKERARIAELFVKHGAKDVPVTPLNLGGLFKAKGRAVAEDFADILFADQPSNFTGPDDKPTQNEKIGIASTVLTTLGNIMGAIGTTMGISAATNAAAQAPEGSTRTAPVNAAPEPCPEGKEKDANGQCVPVKKIFGLTYMQAAIAGVVLLAVGALIYFSSTSKKAA